MSDAQAVSLLLVDDHVENLLALEAVLGGGNYRLVRADSGEEALRCVLREEFAVIVMDVQMPGLDGFETARLIKSREKTKDTPILFISATSREAVDQFQGYSAGAIDYLVKPIVAPILKAKIAAFVRLYLNNRELEERRRQLERQKEELEAVNRELLRVTYGLTTAEAKSRMIFETSIDGMFLFNDRGLIESVNPAMVRLFGYPPSELVGHPVDKVLPGIGEMRRKAETDESEDRLQFLTGIVREMTACRSNGSFFEAEIQLGQSTIDEQRLYACTVRDITELKGTLRQLTEAKNAAESASRAKSEFLAVMSHEIRTPMNGLIGMNDLMQDTPMTAEQRGYSHAIRDNANRLLTVMNNILDFTSMESGEIELDDQPFSIRECLADIAGRFQEEADRKGLELFFEAEDGVPDYVVGDPHRYRQILHHLIDNAVKFTESGGIYILVSTREEKTEDGCRIRLETTVQDTGECIPESQRAHLFLPFSQQDSSMTRKHGGTGLGLAVCQTLAKAMGGHIRLAPVREQEGNRFVCLIRVIPFEWPAEFPRLPFAADSQNQNNRPVLIIARDSYRRRLLSVFAGRLGMMPYASACPAAAFTWPHRMKASAAIVDGMRDEDGAVLRQWAEDGVISICIQRPGQPAPTKTASDGIRLLEGRLSFAGLSEAVDAWFPREDMQVQSRARRV